MGYLHTKPNISFQHFVSWNCVFSLIYYAISTNKGCLEPTTFQESHNVIKVSREETNKPNLGCIGGFKILFKIPRDNREIITITLH